jgi:hypothetical protein
MVIPRISLLAQHRWYAQKDHAVNKIDLLQDHHELGCGVGKQMIRGVMRETGARWKGKVRNSRKPRNQGEAALPTVG